ncbi:hypothetical protein [uncultured Paracoccus sp.]|uniref:hypothetical protein n=1 Tax=uncultured Paracoccus sp. TaxID=189685 RepID=UPI00262960DA|nr:hypothetical protein [uncultured Paracoccus sp.]
MVERNPKRKRKTAAAFIAAGTANLRRIAANRDAFPKCGAMSKTTGQPCRQLAMANGRCYYHGGRTPRGKDWHRTQWPDKSAPDAIAKMENKLKMMERARKARERRLAKMTPEEHAAHVKWHRERPTGSPEYRERKRAERKQNEDARRRFAGYRAKEPDPIAPNPADPSDEIQIRNIEELDIFK